MNTREQFEAAWRKEYPLHSSTAFTRSGFDPERYANTRVQDGWLMWQAAILQAATRDALSADAVDAQRLNWLDQTNERFKMGWRVGIAPAGNVTIQRVIELGEDKTSIRAAIDKAIAARAPKGDGND